VPLAQLFAPGIARVTTLLTIAYFAHIMTFYFILKWIPKIVADMGFAPPEAARVLVLASLGGMVGSLAFGLLTLRTKLPALTIAAMIASVLLVILFGRGDANLSSLSLVAAIAGFATNAGVVGLYAMIAEAFPTGLRATATGFVIGVGRGGSALAPVVSGFLFAAGYGLPTVAALMALGSLVAAVAIVGLGRRAAR
jgi:predicted MFS family arabinose efflux permease